MRWKVITEEAKFEIRKNKLCRWHKKFAWFPVKITNKDTGKITSIWLEYVGCKKVIYTMRGEFRHITCIGKPMYCTNDELVFKALSDNDIIDTSVNGPRQAMAPAPNPSKQMKSP